MEGLGAGGAAVVVVRGLGWAEGVGSGVDQASLDPQASESEKLERVLEALASFGAGCCWGAGFERLKAEKSPRSLGAGIEAGAGGFGFGFGAGAEGEAKSKRSEEADGFVGGAGAVEAKLKEPKSSERAGARFA